MVCPPHTNNAINTKIVVIDVTSVRLSVCVSEISIISTEESGYHATRSLIANNIKFNALFAASDLIAIGAIRALKEANINVPKDVAVVGFDNIAIASFVNPPLTTIEQNTTLAGQMLVENLLKLIREEDVQSTLLPPVLIARGSS